METGRSGTKAIVALLVLGLCGWAGAVDSNGLISHWEFDEGEESVAYDSAGDNDGSIYGAQWTTGQIGGALDFDGVTDYVEIADSPELRFNGVESFSISVWFKRLVDMPERELLVGKGFAGDPENMNYALYIGESDDTVRWFWEHGSGTDDDLSSGVTAEVGQWCHAVGVWDGNSQIIYVNGLEENAVTPVGMPDSSWNRPVVIGRATGGSVPTGLYFNGVIDDVRVYGRALSAEEVQQLYEEGAGPGPEPTGVFYVDGLSGSDLSDGLSLARAFATIQKGIDEANDGNTILVYPAVYTEAGEGIDFKGKAITVQGVATEAGIAVIDVPTNYAVSFYTGEDANSILKNFVIRNSFDAVFIAGASPTISNLTVVDNEFGIAAYAGAQSNISNCIFYNNIDGDLYGCQARYSFVEDDIMDGLVSHWKFDEGEGGTAYDSVATNHGTINGATWTSGLLDGALDFDGVDDYVDLGNDASLHVSSYTLAAWIKPEALEAGTEYRIISNGGWANYNGAVDFLLDWDNKLTILNQYGSMQDVYRSTSTTLFTLSRWAHVAATYSTEDNIPHLYLNGAEVNGTFDSGSSLRVPNPNPSWNMHIGTIGSPLNMFFNGTIDEVAIYNRALSAEEVQHVYGYGLDPMFADANARDYHLLSERGRYWPEHDVWVLDKVTSPCVDGGDPNDNPGDERMPNGGRINMGAYGGTPYASMSEMAIRGDISWDGIVNMKDLAILAEDWLEREEWFQ